MKKKSMLKHFLLLKHPLCTLLAMTLGTFSCMAQPASPEPTYEKMTSGAPPKGLPSEPGWGYLPHDPKAWTNWNNGLMQRNKQGNIDIVFIGDSLTYGWINIGKETWARDYEPLKAVNYGIGGDTTRQLLWRINHGTLDGISPKLIVLMIGTNNLYNDHNSGTDEQIADGIQKVIELIQQKTPNAKILLLSILPRQTKYFCDRITAINSMASKKASGEKIRYLDVSAGFTDSEGKANATLFDDGLVHINAQGYQLISKTLKPVVEEMLR